MGTANWYGARNALLTNYADIKQGLAITGSVHREKGKTMAVLIDGITKEHLEEILKYARHGANNAMLGHGLRIEEVAEIGTGYECFHCLHRSVIRDSDFDFEDYGREGEGIVHVCHCTHCGAEIEYYVGVGEDDE